MVGVSAGLFVRNVLNMLPGLRVIGLAGAPNKPVLADTGPGVST